LDAGWNSFTEMVVAKAASAGRTVIFVNPRMTSQLCSGCGAVVRKDLSVRWHSCACGTELDRDINSAKLILNLGHQHPLGRTGPTREAA
jgi:putative transposase